MILADKIIYLRKKAGWSQEDLAMEMGVSRQSVSKWEGALSVPDMDKILKMSEVFGVSTDFLLKEDVEVMDDSMRLDEETLHNVSAEEATQFLTDTKIKARKIALGVLVIILSPVILIASSYSEETLQVGNLAYIIGMFCLLALVATGVIIFISTFSISARYKYLEEEEFSLMYGVKGIVSKRKDAFNKEGYTLIGLGVAIIIIGVFPVILGSEMFEGSENIYTALTVALIAFGVYPIVYAGVQFAGYDKLLQLKEYSPQTKKSSKITEVIAGPYWLLTTAIYLLMSFQSNAWDKTWIIWPVAGVLFGAIAALVEGLHNMND